MSTKSGAHQLNLEKNATEAAAFLKLVANEKRILILCKLLQGEASVAELQDIIPVSQSGLSQHMGILRRGGLIESRRIAQSAFYSLSGTAHGKTEKIVKALLNRPDLD